MEEIVAYCVKCKEKRPIEEAQALFTEAARPAVRGKCPVCGTTMFRFGQSALHEGMTPPAPAPKAARKAPASRAKPKSSAATSKKGKKGSAKKGSAKKSSPPAAPRAGRSGRKLVVVESPAKARTIGKVLGSDYEVVASLGHVRDLLKSRLSVEVEQAFEPTYRVPNEKKEVVRDIAVKASKAREIWLATDPDREGEAIAWHLLEAAEMPHERVRRVVFHEITPKAIHEAFSHPRPLDMQLVDAQQARRILDRLVGFNLSPLLWKKVRGRLSAGRVQSVALRMLVERERDIRDFVPVEYWSIHAHLTERTSRARIELKLHRVEGEEPHLPDEERTMQHVAALRAARYIVSDVRKSERRRRPSAPFTTSTLQQEASRRLGFSTTRTMALAQQLYEGVALGDEGETGLITYMRTDSVNIAREAADEARRFIAQRFGAAYVPSEIPSYKTRAKKAQEAHEAIRPTNVQRSPEQVARFLEGPQLRLYTLVWQRFVASQMENALFDQTTVEAVGDVAGQLPEGTGRLDEATVAQLNQSARYLLRCSGSVVRFPGFLALYEESRDEDAPDDEEASTLPMLTPGERLDLRDVIPTQHFTQAPPRFTDATLVRTLEENGIGRPSTYAPIVNTLSSRGYAERDNKRLVPTELGELVTTLLVDFFPDVLDVGFTAQMEEELDGVAEGALGWVEVLQDFYAPFSQRLVTAQEEMEKIELVEELAGEACEKCGREMVIKMGRYGKFIACPGFPECRNTKPYLETIGVACPTCRNELAEKRTKGGRIFYGCSTFPECDFSTWKRPVPLPCPACAGLLVESSRSSLQCLACESRFERDELDQRHSSAVEAEVA